MGGHSAESINRYLSTMTTVIGAIKKIGRHYFTTAEVAAVSGKSTSAAVQALNGLEKQGVVMKIYRGVWAEVTQKLLSPYGAIPFVFPLSHAYVSFISALHLHGIIEQIPQVITLASTSHTRVITTRLGTFHIHQIHPSFFAGFDWYNRTGDFLIAEPEKALADCLYLTGYKRHQYGHFPELHFSKNFSFKKVLHWIRVMPNARMHISAAQRLKEIQSRYG